MDSNDSDDSDKSTEDQPSVPSLSFGETELKYSLASPTVQRMNLCERCSRMTTEAGWTLLQSEDGYKHYNRRELIRASRKCTLCFHLWMLLRHLWSPHCLGNIEMYTCAKPGVGFTETLLGIVDIKAATSQNTVTSSALLDFGGGSQEQRALPYPTITGALRRPENPYLQALATSVIVNNVEERFWDSSMRMFFSQNQSRSSEVMTVDSELVIPKVRQWLEACDRIHETCKSIQAPHLPTRVIEIGSESQRSRLYLSRPGERAPYVALSYCWGNFQDYVTTESLVESLTTVLPIETMPQTILDAITTTRKLGFQYLWVDALCIIQDSTSDKTHEIGRMRDVYKNASLTIAATSSFSVADGFLGVIQSPSFGVRSPDGSLRVTHMLHGKLGQERPEPLDTRAWALQESLLSRRLLSFASTQIYWRCRFPQSKQKLKGRKIHTPLHMPSALFGGAPARVQNFDLPQHVLWPRLVTEYSSRKLTDYADRLPAIGGMASELATIWNDTYLAGLWQSSLMPLLAWTASHDNMWDDPIPPAAYQAPSWSWASINSEIDFSQPLNVVSEMAKLISFEIELLDEGNPYGQVIQGRLVLEARLTKAKQVVMSAPFIRPDLISKHNFHLNEDKFYAWLGSSARKKFTVALILKQIENGIFQRQGICTMLSREWLGGDKRIFTII